MSNSEQRFYAGGGHNIGHSYRADEARLLTSLWANCRMSRISIEMS
jgi:hypothetical protein